MRAQNSPKSLLLNLQICRGLAAGLVVVGHALQDSDAIAAKFGLASLHSTINWGCGVDIFFVISGFIMVHVAGDSFGKPGAPRQFISKRLARVVPLYWLVTTALILGAFIAPNLLNVPIGGWQHILASYLFIPDWRPDGSAMRPVMALGWTLNYEMLFYIAFAAAMLLPLRQGIAALTVTFVAAIALRVQLAIHQDQLVFWTDPLVLEFLFGVYIALAWRAGWRLSGWIALAIGALGLALVSHALPDPFAMTEAYNYLRHGIPAAMLVAAATLGPAVPASVLTRFGKQMGDASYALYLCHPFVVRPLREVWVKLGGEHLPLQLYCAFALAGAILAALLLHRYVEKPIARLLQRGKTPPRPRPVEHSPALAPGE